MNPAPNTVDPSFEPYIREEPSLTFSSDGQSRVARYVTSTLERVLGRNQIEEHYQALKSQNLSSQDFFRAALERSNIRYDCDMSKLRALDPAKPIMFIANHPFGVLDGLILCNMALDIAGDFRIVINALLCQDRDIARHFLPIDFSGSSAAARRNVRAKQLAGAALKEGIPLIIFPSGMVSTAGQFGLGPIMDAPWTTFAAKLVMQYQPTVVPVFFHGHNSRPFHIASHVAEPLRMALMMNESLRRFGSQVQVDLGSPLTPKDYEHVTSRQALTNFLYKVVQDTKINADAPPYQR